MEASSTDPRETGLSNGCSPWSKREKMISNGSRFMVVERIIKKRNKRKKKRRRKEKRKGKGKEGE
jgi:hypothetical protein